MGILAGTIPPSARYQLAREAGFSPSDAIVMTAISLAECANCDLSGVNATGDTGLWQINRVHWSSFGGQAALADPLANARAAFGVWKGAGGGQAGFRQWCTYPGGCGGLPGVAQFPALLTRATVAAQEVDPTAPAQVTSGGEGSLIASPGASSNGAETPVLGGALAPLTALQSAAKAGQHLTSRGFWWAVLLFGVGIALILLGIRLFFAEQFDQAAKAAAAQAAAQQAAVGRAVKTAARTAVLVAE